MPIDTTADHVVVGLTDIADSAMGILSLGAITVSGSDSGGNPAPVIHDENGIGVTGGFDDARIDYDASARRGEALRLDFGDATDSATLTLDGLDAVPNGPAERAHWSAYDAEGTLVGTGWFDPRNQDSTDAGAGTYTVDPGEDFTQLVVRASREAGPGAYGHDSSFSLLQVDYVPAAAAPGAPAQPAPVDPVQPAPSDPVQPAPTPAPAAPSPVPAGAIHIRPGDDIQHAVDLASPGATFVIDAGEHRMQSIVPKAGQHFIGEDGAILNGSRELDGFVHSGSAWYVGGQTQEGMRNGTGQAEDGFDRAGYPDAVYMDDKPLLHVGSLGELTHGTYYFDYGADRIYLGDDPSGHSVEAAVSPFAFAGSASDVTIENIVVEKYAAPIQRGAIGGDHDAEHWVIRGTEVRLNYGVGISVGDGSQVLDNFVHDNGNMGVGANGADILFQGNEIAANGAWSGVDTGWEGGGSKFAETQGLVVRGNYVHDNSGYGLWTDINNSGTLYENNRIEYNGASGINHEISYDAVIRGNTLVGNGSDWSPWLFGAGIQIQNSSRVEVYGNTVDMSAPGGNGITLIQQDRGSGSQGPWVTEDNYVHDNVVISRTPDHGAIGAAADSDVAGMLAGGNLFDHNEYQVTSAADEHFSWGDWYSWNAYRAASGWDAHSTLVLV